MTFRFHILILLLFGFNLSFAQVKSYSTERASSKPKIDALFDDPIWQGSDWEGDFTQFQPNPGDTASQRTFFKIRYDDDNLYVALINYDTEPDKIESRLSRRDEWDGDLTGLHIDSYNDKRTSFIFIVNAAGVKNDGFFSNDGDDFDDTWDPIWYVKTRLTTEGWNAEMEIPLSQLRFDKSDNQTWGLQVGRLIFRLDELSWWQHIDQDKQGWVSQYGEMNGLKNIKSKRQLEIAPFFLTQFDRYEPEEGNPFEDGSDFGLSYGVDGKIGLTNDLIMDFAINPDFGQVEADPSQVNLSALEIFFREQRPFFIEGNNITNFALSPGDSPWAQDNLFYSRRIGRAPQHDPDIADHEFIDIPNNSQILGALKITGKTKNGWSIGVLESVTNKEEARIDNRGERRTEAVEPFTNYFLARLQKDVNKGNAVIGGMFTSTNRKIDDAELNFLPKTAVSAGVDFLQYFNTRKYFVRTNFAATKVSGDKEAITELQESSRRFFQRPDSEYMTFDPNRTNLTGTSGTLLFGKTGGAGLRFLFNATYRSPSFESNDLGFLREANNIFHFFWIGYRINKPFSIFRSLDLNTSEWAGWDFDAKNIFYGISTKIQMTFNNNASLAIGGSRGPRSVSNIELRGGPALRLPGNTDIWSRVSSNSRNKLVLNAGLMMNFGDAQYINFRNFFGGMSYRPTNNLSLSLEPSLSLNKTQLQYVDEAESNGEARYLFAELDQKTFNLTTRINFNLTPNLTIQYYGAPFVSSGLYDGFKHITDPQGQHFADRFHAFSADQIIYSPHQETYQIDEQLDGNVNYSFDNPNFNFQQFRSNLVFRWEYDPGSTLFLVWSQNRTEERENNFEFDLKENLSDLFRVSPYDVFLLKFSYRFRVEKWL